VVSKPKKMQWKVSTPNKTQEKATFLKTNSTYYTSKLAEVVTYKITK